MQKTQRILELPLNKEAARVIRARHGIRKTPFVFYNPETGDQFKDLWLGLKKALPKGRIERGEVAHFSTHIRVAPDAWSSGSGDRKRTAGHANITTTMRYAHTNRGAKKRAVRLLEARSDKTVTMPESNKESA
jgi:integrase